MVWSLAVAAQNYEFVSVSFSPSGNLIAAYTGNGIGGNELFYIFNSADGSLYDSKLSYPGSNDHHDFYSRSLLLTDSGAMIVGGLAGNWFGCITCNAEIFRYSGGAG
jgi:hypothetical protein